MNFSEVMGGGPSEGDMTEKYNSVNIRDEDGATKEENERLKESIQKERKIAFNACSILKMEIEYIGNFFFGKKAEKKEKKNGERKSYSEDEADDEGGEVEDEEDYTLSQFYQSNTREELQNQLKNINFEDDQEEETKEEEETPTVRRSDLLSGSDDEKQEEKPKEFQVESGGRGQGSAGKVDMGLFSSGNAQDFDFGSIIKNKEQEQDESDEIEQLRQKSKEEINKNHDLEIEDLDNDDDLVTGGMGIKYDLLTKEEGEREQEEAEAEEDEENDLDIDKMIHDASLGKNGQKEEKEKEEDEDEFFNKFVEDILGNDEDEGSEKQMGNMANIRLGRRRRKRGSEEALDSQDVNDFLDEIAKLEKSEEVEDPRQAANGSNPKSDQKRDIYIQQRDQYFVDDEEVYLNELETDHCNWVNIKSLFRVVTVPEQEMIGQDSENRETVLNYFHDICKGLMNSRTEDFLSFVYSSPEVMDGLIRFGKHEGVQKILNSVLNLYESVNNLNSFRFLKHRFGLYRRLLKSIIECSDTETVNQLARVFVNLVKEKSNIIDANYFIDKILLGSDNHVSLLDKVVRERNAVLGELASLVVKRVVPEEERGFLEESSVGEINKNFGRR